MLLHIFDTDVNSSEQDDTDVNSGVLLKIIHHNIEPTLPRPHSC
jgi:hypothetical protein